MAKQFICQSCATSLFVFAPGSLLTRQNCQLQWVSFANCWAALTGSDYPGYCEDLLLIYCKEQKSEQHNEEQRLQKLQNQAWELCLKNKNYKKLNKTTSGREGVGGSNSIS